MFDQSEHLDQSERLESGRLAFPPIVFEHMNKLDYKFAFFVFLRSFKSVFVFPTQCRFTAKNIDVKNYQLTSCFYRKSRQILHSKLNVWIFKNGSVWPFKILKLKVWPIWWLPVGGLEGQCHKCRSNWSISNKLFFSIICSPEVLWVSIICPFILDGLPAIN